MRPSQAPGIWGRTRWLEQMYSHIQSPYDPIKDYPDHSKPDIAYDDGDRDFWQNQVAHTACNLAQQSLTHIAPAGRTFTYKIIDREAVRQINSWKETIDQINDKRKPGNYCRRHFWGAEHILDCITGDLDVKLAGYNPHPTEDDILDELTFGISSSPPSVIESIRQMSTTYTTMGFCLWENDRVIGMIAGNSTRRNYGRDHMAFGLLQKSPHWSKDGDWGVKAIGLPALFAAHLVGKTQIILEGADDPPGFHRIMGRHGFEFNMRSNPKGYGISGTMIARISDLAQRCGVVLPEPLIPTLVTYNRRETIQQNPEPL